MTSLTRREMALGLGGILLLSGCANGVGGNGAARIDARVDATLAEMYRRFPGTQNLAANANGLLVMPLVTEAGLPG